MIVPNLSRRVVFKSVAGIALLRLGLAGEASLAQESSAPTAIQLSLDRPIDASAAPFAIAVARGLYRAERLSVVTTIANGSSDAIARVASGLSDIGVADINAVIRYRDGADTIAVKAVFVLQNAVPYAIVARRSRGIRDLSDLAGKTVGVAEGDLAIRLWPALVRANGSTLRGVKFEKIGAAVREPMLSAGQVDAVTGFSYLSAVNLRDRGIPADDLVVLRYADNGCVAYGLALIVAPRFAAEKPETVKAFLRAVTAGLRSAMQSPEQAVDDVVAQMDGGARDLEIERLRAMLRDTVVTDEVRRAGLGGIDAARFDASIEQIAEDFRFRQHPAAADIFDARFLPALSARRID